MKMTDMRAKARAIFGPANPEPMPNQPNGAKALQERANARPIPTYKVGGSVKKPTPPQPTAAEREADRKRREEYAKMKVTPENAAAIGRGNRSSGYKMGGKVQTASDTARKLATEMGGMKNGGAMKPVDEAKNPGLKKLPSEVRNKMGYMKKGGKPKDGLAVMIAIGSPMKGMKGMKKPVKKMHGGRVHADGDKPVKKMGGGMMYAEGGAMEPMSSGPSYFQHHGEEKRDKRKLDRRAEGGAMKPVKKAAGGAAKVRKGMMTPEGVITHAMNKVRGK
jgi:hypothetical protein